MSNELLSVLVGLTTVGIALIAVILTSSRGTPIIQPVRRFGPLMLLVVSLSVGGSAQSNVATDREALVALYNATDGANWTDNTNWLSSEPLSKWFGVSTDANGRATKLNLAKNQLTGTIPTQMGNLASLTVLNLANNQLTGSIPVQLSKLVSLTHLYLFGNQLTGSIPVQMSNLASLTVLNLANNQLTGSIPVQLSKLASLTVLNLSGNDLTGSIPTQLGKLASLTHLYLAGNKGLTGPLPETLRHLSNLETLTVSGTNLYAPSDPAFQAWLASITYDGATSEGIALDFAHFANGDGITSEMVFVNVGTTKVRPAIYFYDTQGEPMGAESVVDVLGDLEVAEDGGLTVRTDVEPLGELTISTHGRGELVSGSVRVVSNGSIGSGLRYTIPWVGEAVVGASPPISDAIFPVYRQAGGITTGVAIHNLESSPAMVRCDLMSAGVVRDAVSISLAANGQTSWSIEEAFTAADTSDFAGSVRCDTVEGGLFTAVALGMDPVSRTFITLPVFPVEVKMSRE